MHDRIRTGKTCGNRGSALVAVLWLSAALAAIAFSLATTVRGEVERTSTELDGARAYYLATGALERAMIYMQWGSRFQLPDGSPRYFAPWMTRMHFSFPTGDADVEIAPESARLNLNQASPEDLLRLLAAVGLEPERAGMITRAILDWRTAPLQGAFTDFDRYYLSLRPSFRSRHASFREKEDLLLLRGMTPEIYYGAVQQDAKGNLRPVGGLRGLVTVFGDSTAVDVNTAPPAVLQAVGLAPAEIDAVAAARSRQPFRSLDALRGMGFPARTLARLSLGGGVVYTLRATARWRAPEGRLSDAVRSVGVTISSEDLEPGEPFRVLHWDERLWEGEVQ